MPNTLKSRFKALPLSGKIVLLGSGISFLSVFLPWYSDIDRFNIGDTFLGITGPLYLAGLIVMGAAALSFASIFSNLVGKQLPKVTQEEHTLHFLSSGMSILMLVLSASVFFHSKFGINLTDKTMGAGLILAFTGSGLTLLGAFMVKKSGMELEQDLEPLIDINHEREAREIEHKVEDHVPAEVPVQQAATQRVAAGMDRSQTIEEAMQNGRVEIPDAPTKAWNPIEESINNMKYVGRNETNDIR